MIHSVKACITYIESCGWKCLGRNNSKDAAGRWSFGHYYFKRADPDCKASPQELNFSLRELREAKDCGF